MTMRRSVGGLLAATLACATPARASDTAERVTWDSDAFAFLHRQITDAADLAPVTPAEAPRPTLPADDPVLVDSAEAFALEPAELDAVASRLPAAESALGRRLATMMRQVLLVGEAPADGNAGETSAVVSWNVDSARAEQLASTLEPVDVALVQEIRLSAAVELARRLKRRLAWAPEFLEVGTPAQEMNSQAGEAFTGNAILSRFRLSGLRVLRFRHQADWYVEEKRKPSVLERGRRLAGRALFDIHVRAHEVRPPAPYGGRMALSALINPAGWPAVRVVTMHLENKAKPDLRRQQMREVLDSLERTGEPAVFAGDLNTTGADGRNLTVARMLKARVSGPLHVAELAGLILLRHVPYAGWGKAAFDAFRRVKRLEDPTSRLSAERGLFEDVRKRVGSRPINERDAIGYKHTWVPRRALMGGVLDWMFIFDPGSRLHAHGAATRTAYAEGVSDHAPVEVQLSLR